MKLRHAVALALAGWYLMVPPYGPLPESLSDYDVFDSFDSARECKEAQAKEMAAAEKDIKSHDKDELGFDERFISQLSQSTCIATDDPRLKGK